MSNLFLPRIEGARAIVNSNGQPTPTFLRDINGAFAKIEAATNSVTGQNAAISNAVSTASNASTIAADAVTTATAQTSTLALAFSTTSPTDLLSYGYDPNTGARTISIAAHTRLYGDGTSVAVAAGTVAYVAPATNYYVTYQDSARAGGTVTYTASTNAAVIVQVNGRHLVGSIQTGNQ